MVRSMVLFEKFTKQFDLFTNNIHDLLTNPSLTVSISDTTNIHRFILHLGPEIIVNKTNPTCFNNNDGSLSFSQSNNAAFSINWLKRRLQGAWNTE